MIATNCITENFLELWWRKFRDPVVLASGSRCHRCHLGHREHDEEHAEADNQEYPHGPSSTTVGQRQRTSAVKSQIPCQPFILRTQTSMRTPMSPPE